MSSFKKPNYIKELIKKYKLKSKKSLGQNFLLDSNLTDKIIRKTGDLSNYDILEIGPGPGSLTLSILRALPRNLVVVEKDPRCIPALHELTEFFPNKLTILNEDFLNLNPSTLVKPPSRVIANLPYNAGPEILVRFLESSTWPPFWKTLTLMFQKEVAERIIAQPGSKNYGRLSIISQWRSKAEILFSIPPEAFSPPPKVKSSVIKITALSSPIHQAELKNLSFIAKTAFNQRRKMLRHSLKSLSQNIENVLNSTGILPTSRPEEITIKKFCELSERLKGEIFAHLNDKTKRNQ